MTNAFKISTSNFTILYNFVLFMIIFVSNSFTASYLESIEIKNQTNLESLVFSCLKRFLAAFFIHNGNQF